MELYQPEFLNEMGARANNEDHIYPAHPSETDRLFLVCDGVGGQQKGEVASKLVCKYLAEYFSVHPFQWNDPGWLVSALQNVEGKLRDHLQHYPQCQGMATTLALLHLSEDLKQAVLAWVGDSRVYHIRNGEVLFQSKDHSLVQSLVDMGEITIQEAKDHPKKNVITRAISGVRETRLDQHFVTEIHPDDYFFLCTDGILETLSPQHITRWFIHEQSPAKIRNCLLENAQGKTKDNFSMYLLKIKISGC